MQRQDIAAITGLLAAVHVVLTTLIGGWLEPGYDHSAQYISELGAVDAAYPALINYAGFLPVALLVATFVWFGAPALATSRSAAVGCGLLLGVAAGYLLAALAPCDAGCPASGSARQAIHNLGGVLQYLGGGAGLLLIGAAQARTADMGRTALSTLLAAVTVLGVFFFILGAEPGHPLRGLWQRLAETAIFGWIAITSLRLLARRQRPEPSAE